MISTASIILLATAEDWHHHGDIGEGWWVVMVVGMIVFWALVIAGAVWLVRTLLASRGGAGGARPGGVEGAREILDRRLADGELDIDEYRRRREALERGD